MPSVTVVLSAYEWPTTQEHIHAVIMKASETLPQRWLAADLPVWENDPLFWMMHPAGAVSKDALPLGRQAEHEAEANRRGQVAVFVTLTDDPVMKYVVGRLKIVDHE